MRVLILSESYPKNMGYFGTVYPKYLARLGIDVHLAALALRPYYQSSSVAASLDRIIGPDALEAGRIEQVDGYTVHQMPFNRRLGFMRMLGMRAKIAELKPDVVYCLTCPGWLALEAAFWRPFFGYKLFVGSHTTASTFPPAQPDAKTTFLEQCSIFLRRTVPGRLVSLQSVNCYAPTVDSAEIAWRFFGLQKHKVFVMHLGIDTDFFFPPTTEAHRLAAKQLRESLGFGEDELVCIYTGKLTETKNVLIVAKAIEEIRQEGYPFRLLVVGEGSQRQQIASYDHARVLDFMPYSELGSYYRCSDIAVWPTNESTSMLDAAACGLPLVVSTGVVYRDHVNGNGLVFEMGDVPDLKRTLISLADPALRIELGEAGAKKMRAQFSWLSKARTRLADYELALETGSGSL